MASALRGLLKPARLDASPLDARLRLPLLAVAGLASGASPLFFGYFDPSVWGPIAIGLIALAVGLLIAKPAIPSGLRILAVIGLFLFAAWCLISMGWAESGDRALTEGDRWLLYGTFLFLLVLLISKRADAELFVAALVVGVLIVAAYDLVKMLGGEAALFGDGRLLEPLGYINGMGGFYLLGFWPLFAVAERTRQPALAGIAAALATLLAALAVLTVSRGTVFAFVASALVVLALLPGRRRRTWLLLVVIGSLTIAWGPLSDVAGSLGPHQFYPAADVIEQAAKSALILAIGVGVVWGLVRWSRMALAGRGPVIPLVSTVLLAVTLCLALAVAATAISNPIQRISRQYDSFTHLQPVATGTRFNSGGGNRYDYWRIAWKQFSNHPIEGVGAGNFDRTYFLERRTNEDVRQAHSIELQALGETGLVGAVMLALFFVPVFIGTFRRGQAARRRQSEIGLSLAASGMFIVWLAQTSVDWLHLIPGLTGIALGAGAILLLPADAAQEKPALRPFALLAVIGALVLAVVAIVFIGRPVLAEHLRTEAQKAVSSQPKVALEKASESLSLNPDSLQGYYLEAAAWARLHAYQPANHALKEAIAREPHNYVSWALLGDLTTRHGDISAAMKDYAKASALNPRDRGLKALATNRKLLERLHREPEASVLLPDGEA